MVDTVSAVCLFFFSAEVLMPLVVPGATWGQRLFYVIDPLVWGPVLVFLYCLWHYRAANGYAPIDGLSIWFLGNACFIHWFDGIVGWFDLVYLARQQYGNIDHRFFDNEPTEKIMSGVEFFIMLPLGFVVFTGKAKRATYYLPVVICLCTFELMANIVFYGAEWLRGWVDINTYCLTQPSFSLYCIAYFWAGVITVGMILYTVVPTYLIYTSVKQLMALQEGGAAGRLKSSPTNSYGATGESAKKAS